MRRTTSATFYCILAASIVFESTAAPAQAPPPATPDQASRIQAQPFPLTQVQLLDGPFKQAMERNADYLLSLEPDRLLHNVRQYAGLQPKADRYGGWESQGIAGHTLGHYLTALSQQFAATGDKRFRDRIDYIVSEMAECQQAYGDGYVGALPPKELATVRGFKEGKVELAGPHNFKGGAWVPWYTQHKILAGLTDAWVLAGNDQAKAVALKLADWTGDVTAGLTDDQLQTMLQVEHGGMLDALVQLYALTGDQRYLDTSRRFYHRAICEPFLAGRDDLAGKHANTQFPKIIGQARTYEVTGDRAARKIAEFFWDCVVKHHTYVTGSNSDNEQFFPESASARHLTPASAETCNTYNMLKLTEHLIGWQPKVDYADYYERALYNHILASQDPTRGMFTYYLSLKPGLFKTYSTPFDSFWCCVGTGMENHSKYQQAIYFHGDDDLYINLFIPSILSWPEKGLVLEQRTRYPRDEHAEFTFKAAPTDKLTLRIRCPTWAAGPLTFQFNGEPLSVDALPGHYAEITRAWKAEDRLRVTVPMSVRSQPLEGAPDRIAFLYGPLVLAGDFGPQSESKSFPYAKGARENFGAKPAEVPALVTSGDKPVESFLTRSPGDQLAFQTQGLARPADVTLRPLLDLPYNRYTIYWDVLSPAAWLQREVSANEPKPVEQK